MLKYHQAISRNAIVTDKFYNNVARPICRSHARIVSNFQKFEFQVIKGLGTKAWQKLLKPNFV
jgi:hypothetical protein